MKEKTITLDQAFFGEKKFTLEEYQKRWRGHPQEIWGFLIDFGTIRTSKIVFSYNRGVKISKTVVFLFFAVFVRFRDRLGLQKSIKIV